MFSKKIFFALLITCFSSLLALEPPTKAELEKYKKDGSLYWRTLNALALGNHLVSPDLIQNLKYRLQSISLRTKGKTEEEINQILDLPPARKGMPTKGTVKILTLLLDFSDYPASQSQASITAKLFGNGEDYPYPYESLRNYYRRSSYYQLEIQGNVLGWYRPSYPRSSISQTTSGREALIKEALNYYDSLGHDFSQYDNDANGTIDYLVVIWTGPDNGWSNFWWGYATSFSDSSYRLDGKRLSKYSWQWESRPYPGTFKPYVVIHETGHALGLPDYYDYDATVGPDGGVGGLDMMDANTGDHNCFSKFLLDWISPLVYNYGRYAIALSASGNTQDALLAIPEFSSDKPFSEFYMVQNRFRVENDNNSSMPNDGLLIWHVDAQLDQSGNNFLYNNSYSDHKLLRLMEADGQEEIERGYRADAEDYYISGREFGPDTFPNSHRYDGSDCGLYVSRISPSSMSMAFSLVIDYSLYPPASFSLQRVENNFIFFKEYVNKLSWGANPANHTQIVKFRLFKKPKGVADDAYTLLAELEPTVFIYEDRGLKKDELYAYRITCMDKNGFESTPAEVSN